MYFISIVWITFFVIVTSGDSSSLSNDGGTYCDGTGWEVYRDEKCYKLIKQWSSRDQAKVMCAQEEPQEDGSIPQLATIKSSDEQTYLSELVFNTSTVTINVWIGAKRLNDNKFVWDDGSEVGEFTNWAEGSPTNNVQQSCVVMKPEYMKIDSSTAGQWRDMPCEMPNYVICEKLPRWSITKLQQTLLETRKELKDSNDLLAMELDDTKNKLAITTNELSITKNQLASTTNEVSLTKNQLASTANELGITKNQLTSTTNELSITKNQLSQSTNRLEAQITEAKDKLVPIGILYTQLPNEKPPSEIWPWMTWTDVSSAYAGVFFRVVGGGSAPFGQEQQVNAPRITRMETHPRACEEIRSIQTVIGGWSSLLFTGDYGSGRQCLRYETSGGEVRPRNMAIRVWRRSR